MNTQQTTIKISNEISKKELRDFAFIMASMIILLFALFFPWLYELDFSYTPYFISAFFIAMGLIAPKLLTPVYNAWLKFSHILGLINSKILLFIIFYLLITPMGLIARLFSFDPMRRKVKSDSYYLPREDNNNMENPF